MDINFSSIELVRLSPKWGISLALFFQDLKKEGDDLYFSPHATDIKSINQIINQSRRDLYYLLIKEKKVLGYGLLRGWDEGYKIPSLGLAIHPSVRGVGVGSMLMNFLHKVSFLQGASQVRLRVHKNNVKAISLYKRLDYILELDTNKTDYLVGFKSLKGETL